MKPGARLKAAAAALLAGLAATSGAGAYTEPTRGAPAGAFDLYILALSWSPGFCAAGGARKAPDQCASGTGLGFVVHGLWPQYERGYPIECGPQGRFVQRRDLDVVEGVVPSPGLARFEWKKHGTCSGLPPSQYFQAVADAYHAFETPPDYRAPDQPIQTTPLEVQRAVAAANPGLRTDMIAVDCGRDDSGRMVLEEVRLCLTRDLRGYRACPAEVQRDACRSPTITVPALR